MRIVLLGLLATSFLAAPLQAQRQAYYFFELGGAGGLASMNLEVNPVAGLRLRGGAGLFIWPSIPLMATYTIGSEENSLELGVGGTLVLYPDEHRSDDDGFLRWRRDDSTLLIGTAALGYRHRTSGGFLFRATMTPLYGHGRTVMWVGISAGHAF